MLQPSVGRRKRSYRSAVLPVLGVAAVLVLGLALLGSLGDSDNGGGETRDQGKSASRGEGKGSTTSATTTTDAETAGVLPGTTSARGSQVSLALRPTADVWVCLVDQSGRALVNGETLSSGEAQGPFDGKGFEVTFGNGSVEMTVDGEPAKVPAVAEPIGYSITTGEVRRLDPASQPDCL